MIFSFTATKLNRTRECVSICLVETSAQILFGLGGDDGSGDLGTLAQPCELPDFGHGKHGTDTWCARVDQPRS